MTREEATKELTEWLDGCCGEELEPTRKALRMAVGALKAQTDGDTISRQAAIDGLEEHYVERITLNDWQEGWNAALDWLESVYLDGLPSAQPEPSQVARDIATIIENEQDMRVILKNAQNDIVHCRDCRFCHKSSDWRHLQSFGSSIWYCGKGRGLNLAEAVELDDYCSSAERRIDGTD